MTDSASGILGLRHAGIQVVDADRSVAFYERLGLRVVARFINDRPYVQRLVGYDGVALDVALLRIPGSEALLEILEYRNVARCPVNPATANPGTGHICLRVRDLDSLYATLKAQGVDFVSPPQTADIGPNAGGRVVYLKDPDGIRVELFELPARSDRDQTAV